MKTPSVWMNRSGTGETGASDGGYITTEDDFILTTELGEPIIVDDATSDIKITTYWDNTSKVAITWRVDGYNSVAANSSTVTRITESGSVRITEDGNVRIVEGATYMPKPSTDWTES